MLLRTGAVADNFYHRYLDDIAAMRLLGVKRFRMSIAWPRILPNGDGQVNQRGLDFYSRVLEALLVAGIEPHITLYHWDLPQVICWLASMRQPGRDSILQKLSPISTSHTLLSFCAGLNQMHPACLQ